MKAEVHYSPEGGCTAAVVAALAGEKKGVLMAAYQFTSPPILEALTDCLKRGVPVRLVHDQQGASSPTWKGRELAAAGGEVVLDGKHRIMHDKYLVLIGSRKVVTGSFNWTVSAETSNAENLLVITDRNLMSLYQTDWNVHQNHATPLAQARLVMSAAYPMPAWEE